ncbi:tryptophan 7-halogenase [Pseudoalteromonas sp. C2R02]|uniref:tryptophan halogenase family protein n=1 Tax=Pseudoalteromonas sp. C2R02 TaxID=2841565 RepID=UPI001C09A2B5|nr:tryptophan halogenase family protein [Pseudoalteromonas sp. C2R02]MBU2968983.1 tryptophan 7-halogenase [Pseudoalteromonas sp. C2R02]
MKINKIAIVGGGTAGWLAANHLGKALINRPNTSITLIESPDIPSIGVGEGTVPMMRETLKSFGISETDFVQQCDVTFKQSVKFVNWLDKNNHGENNYYHHLFDYPFPLGDDLAPFWLSTDKKTSFADIASFQGAICDAGLGPKTISTPEYQGTTTYAYHLNAKKFAKLLAKNACEKFNVEHQIANVTDVTLKEDGSIKSLNLESDNCKDGTEFDFYIDCSGFSSFLMRKHLGVQFIDKSNELLIDTAIVVQVPTNIDDDIPSYTIATAHQAGWIWDIALPQRRGVGFVFSSKYMNEELAKEKLAKYLGEDLSELPHRSIPMNIGYLEKFWHKNCVAIGLSQGFVEPLEATAILLADFCAKQLAQNFPEEQAHCENLSNMYNKRITYCWDRVIDFIKLHYCISDRKDSKFWLDNKKEDGISEHLKQLLLHWQSFSPKTSDFFSKFEIFDVENFLYVLYGMKYQTTIGNLSESYLAKAKSDAEQVKKHADILVNDLPKHRELIDKINQFGMQKL